MAFITKHRNITLLIVALFLIGFFGIAQSSFNEKINYQGKLTDSSNLAVSDGAYDMVFKLYTVAGGGSAIWTESWTNAALFTDSSTTFTDDGCSSGVDKMAYTTDTNEGSLAAGQLLWNTTKKESAVIQSVSTDGSGGYICFYDTASTWASSDTITNRIYVKNGLFSVMLGTVSSLSSIDFNQTLYLGVTIGADSEMKPRKVIGAVPAAFESKQLGGYTWDVPGTIGSTTPNTGAFTTLSADSLSVSTSGNITMADDTWIGLASDGGRIVFDSTPDPDTLTINTADLLFSADNTYNIGASGATRPATGYFGTSVYVGGTLLDADELTASGALTVQSTGADLTLTNVTSGNIAITSLGNLTETIATGSTYTLKDGATNFLAIDASGAIAMTPTSGQDLNVNTINSITQTSDDDFNAGTTSNTTVSSGSVTLSEFVCGTSSVTFTYKGGSVTYGTVSHNSECWLDRNLGASQVATAFDDSAAYGDLFQWGRLDDLHQNRDSGTTTDLSSTDNPGHSNFIKALNSPYDWRSPQNDNLWQGVSGTNNPCPSGWRIPTEAEWNTERLSWSENNRAGAYASPLKLTSAGYRGYSNASLSNVGSGGDYWSSTTFTTYARRLNFTSSDANMNSKYRAYGFSVRCVKD